MLHSSAGPISRTDRPDPDDMPAFQTGPSRSEFLALLRLDLREFFSISPAQSCFMEAAEASTIAIYSLDSILLRLFINIYYLTFFCEFDPIFSAM
jgi:hypothetical protein